MALTVAALLCFASGFILLSWGWPVGTGTASYLLRLSLSAGFGLGIFSITFFLSRAAGIAHFKLVDVATAGLLVILYLLFREKNPQLPSAVENGTYFTWLRRTIAISFTSALVVAAYSAIMRIVAHPHGDGWDAFAIWNVHARFLALNGPEWRDVFTPLIPGSHPDYPLLLPAATAHFWNYLGRDATFVPAMIAFTFTFAAAALLYSALSILRGRMLAMLGTISLLATPAFIEQGTAQYADVPLSFFILATLALLCLHSQGANREGGRRSGRLLVLAGTAAGLAAWTKNEGLLFLASLVVSGVLVFWFRDKESSASHTVTSLWGNSIPLWLGMIPPLVVLLYFKHAVAGPGELFTDRSSILHKLLTPTRYWAVIQWFAKSPFRFGHWMIVPGTLLLASLYVALKKEPSAKRSPAFRTSVMALLLTVAGYFAIYLITPYEIYWHLRFSLDRLLLQIWPSAIFLFFLGMPDGITPELTGQI